MLSLMIAAQALSGSAAAMPVPACRPMQLRLALDGRDGDFNGMSHAGTALSVRNVGADCTLPALPIVSFRDARGKPLPASRSVPIGMHPGPVMLPVRLAGGHRAVAELRWVAGPVFAQNRSVKAASLTMHFGKAILRAWVAAVLYGEANKAVTFEQTPFHVAEGMARN